MSVVISSIGATSHCGRLELKNEAVHLGYILVRMYSDRLILFLCTLAIFARVHIYRDRLILFLPGFGENLMDSVEVPVIAQ